MSTTNTNPAGQADMLLKIGEYVEQSGAALAGAEKLARQAADEQLRVSELLTPTLQLLKEAGLVIETEVDEVRRKLASHSDVLRMMGRMAKIMQNRTKAAHESNPAPAIGRGVDNAPAGSTTNGHRVPALPTGYSPGPTDLRPSDAVFLDWLN